MSTRPLAGVRVVEVAQFVFVPAAAAVLADWGAEVIKVEHSVTGDPQRAFQRHLGGNPLPTNGVNPGIEHANRGKRSIGLSLDNPEALDVLYRLVADADVFVTNFLPDARQRLRIDVEHIQAINPNIIYARGSAVGVRGPEAARGGFDNGSFWARAGGSSGVTPPELDTVFLQPGAAYGDTISGTALAGGIVAALFGRERTGEASVVDVSLLGSGAWALGLAVNMSMASGNPWKPLPLGQKTVPSNPLVGSYKTADNRYILMVMNRASLYWVEFCNRIDRPDLAVDPRFATPEALMDNAAAAAELIAVEIARYPLDEWVKRLEGFDGQWTLVQNTLELGRDEQLRANGHIAKVVGADGSEYEVVTSPVQFDETPIQLRRAPTFAEDTDELLRSLGFDDDGLIALKISGAVT